jgi:hemerythrin-like domain-containing protein
MIAGAQTGLISSARSVIRTISSSTIPRRTDVMHSLFQKLHREHANLTHLLDILESELNDFHAGRESNFDLKIELLEYIESHAEQYHHPLEDELFELAKNACQISPATLARVSEQHRKLTGLARQFRESLEGIIQGDIVLREEVEIEGRQFIAAQREHLNLEERELFPALEACLSPEELDRVAASRRNVADPLLGRNDPNRFRNLYRYLARHVGKDTG